MGLLDGKKALICGVTNKKSIAWGIAKSLYANGARLAFACVEGNLRRVKKLVPQVECDTVISCDVQKDEEIVRALDEVGCAYDGGLDILVHSIAYADLNDLGGEFIDISRHGWNNALAISAYSLVCLARYSRPLMNKSGGGSIITLSFMGGDKVVPGYNIMGVAKSALEMSVRYLAYDLGPENIRVNAISAGPVTTISSLAVEDFETSLHSVKKHSPLLRNVTLEDLGGAAVFLASDLSSAVTGEIVCVDAGVHIMAPATKPHPKWRD